MFLADSMYPVLRLFLKLVGVIQREVNSVLAVGEGQAVGRGLWVSDEVLEFVVFEILNNLISVFCF